MTEESQRYNLSAIRDLLLSAFNPDELKELFYYSDNPELRDVVNQFLPGESLPAWVQKAVAFCERRDLVPQLLAEIKDANPRAYARFEDRLYTAPPPTASALVLPLPADLADFTGRQTQIDRVRHRLHERGIVTINGMGGIGKTALAVHVAHQLIAEGRFPDAQLYIDLRGTDPPPADPVAVLDSLLNAILDPNPNRARDLKTLQALWRWAINSRDAILILDDAADATQVRLLLPGCPTCAVLVTSRFRFNLPGARRLDLRPMRPGEARCLLQELAPHLDDDGADRIAGLCGRLPQALRVAGNYLDLNDDVTPDDYAGMLADEQTRLTQLRDPDDRDLDVAATIFLSVAQLDADPLDTGLRRAWALLSLFPAAFDLPAAAALWDESDEGQALTQLQSLRNRSLVTYDRGSARYHQHDLVRLAASAQLEAPLPVGDGGWGEGEVTAAHLRLARHYGGVARDAKELYKQGGDNVLQGLALFELEWPHIRAGQAWAAAHAEGDDEAARLCSDYPDAAVDLLDLRLHPRDLIAWFESALRAARRLGDEQAEAVHLGSLGSVYYRKGEWDRAIESHEQSLTIKERVGGTHGMATTYNNLGLVYAGKGEWGRAIEYYEQSLETKDQVGDIHGMAVTYMNLGGVYSRKGEWDRAIELYKQSLAAKERVGDIRGMARTLVHLGVVYFGKGEWDRAIEFYKQALATLEQVGDIHVMAQTTNNLGMVYARKGEWDRAIKFCEQALENYERVGDIHGMATTFGNLGVAYRNLGETRKAIEYLQQALATQNEIGDRQSEGNQLVNLGNAYRDLGETDRARDYWTQALVIFEAIGDPNAATVRRLLSELED